MTSGLHKVNTKSKEGSIMRKTADEPLIDIASLGHQISLKECQNVKTEGHTDEG